MTSFSWKKGERQWPTGCGWVVAASLDRTSPLLSVLIHTSLDWSSNTVLSSRFSYLLGSCKTFDLWTLVEEFGVRRVRVSANNQGKRKNILRAGQRLGVDASSVPGIVSRGNDLSAAGGQFLRWGRLMRWSFQKARASALFSCLEDDHRVGSSFPGPSLPPGPGLGVRLPAMWRHW